MENEEIKQRNNELFAKLKKYPENSKEYQNIVAKIVENNQRLATSFAIKYFPNIKSTTIRSDDLIQEGLMGVLKAIKFYDPEKGTFANYAAKFINNNMIDYLKREKRHQQPSLEDDIKWHEDGDKQKLGDTLAAPINAEEDIIEQDEIKRQIAWVKKNLDKLSDLQRQVLIEKYLSRETSVTDDALAKVHECSKQNISKADKDAISALKEMLYFEFHPEQKDLALTNEEKLAIKETLKNLISTALAPLQKKAMLRRFYSTTKKTNQQVATELDSTENIVKHSIKQATKKLCTLYNGVQDEKHLTREAIRNILKFRTDTNTKER